jgi:hypothetical protein
VSSLGRFFEAAALGFAVVFLGAAIVFAPGLGPGFAFGTAAFLGAGALAGGFAFDF